MSKNNKLNYISCKLHKNNDRESMKNNYMIYTLFFVSKLPFTVLLQSNAQGHQFEAEWCSRTKLLLSL